MTCATCRHSTGRASTIRAGWVLWCVLHGTIPTRACDDYCREPGAD